MTGLVSSTASAILFYFLGVLKFESSEIKIHEINDLKLFAVCLSSPALS